MTDRAALASRITEYLANGGLFNPEYMNHGAVRDLLIDCRAALRDGGWISVGERLLDSMNVVLIYQGDASHTKVTASYIFGKWEWTDSYYKHPCCPEYWMPLPAAPTKEGRMSNERKLLAECVPTLLACFGCWQARS